MLQIIFIGQKRYLPAMVLLFCRTLLVFNLSLQSFSFFSPLTHISFATPSHWLCHQAGSFIKELNSSQTHLATHMTVNLLKNVPLSPSLALVTLDRPSFITFPTSILPFTVFVIDLSELTSLYLQRNILFQRQNLCPILLLYPILIYPRKQRWPLSMYIGLDRIGLNLSQLSSALGC